MTGRDPLSHAMALMDAAIEINAKADILGAALTILKGNREVREIFLRTLEEAVGA